MAIAIKAFLLLRASRSFCSVMLYSQFCDTGASYSVTLTVDGRCGTETGKQWLSVRFCSAV